MKAQRAAIFFVKLALVFSAVLSAEVQVESSIFKTIQEKRTANIFISLKNGNAGSVLSQVTTQNYATKADRITALYQALKDHADATQSNVVNTLNSYRISQEKSSMEISSFWITNQIFIRNADMNIVEQLLAMDDVSEISEEKIYLTDRSAPDLEEANGIQAEAQWGVDHINAPQVWASGNRGAGVVVATIDTGVRGTHDALRDGFRKDHGWFDPASYSQSPEDKNGHGTHVTGTIVGRTRGIGVAPEAQWVACKGCGDDGLCKSSSILQCAEWVVCPTDSYGNNRSCSLAPDIVSNSWTGADENTGYNYVIDTWVLAGIVPIFAAGNRGPWCETVTSPGTNPKVISVGATDGNNYVADYSSRGPSKLYAKVQPDIAAPGSSIVSAGHTGDTEYNLKSGTSMAAPHVAGLVALLKSAKPDLTINQIRKLILAGAQPTRVSASGERCGGRSQAVYPNNHSGHGRVNATASIAAIDTLDSSSLSIAAAFRYHEFVTFSFLMFGAFKVLIF